MGCDQRIEVCSEVKVADTPANVVSGSTTHHERRNEGKEV